HRSQEDRAYNNRTHLHLPLYRSAQLRCPSARAVQLGRGTEPLQGVLTGLMVRVYCQRPPEVGDGLVAPSPDLEEIAPVAVGYCVVRIDPDGFAVVGDGAVIIPFALNRAAPVVVSDGEVRIDPDGLIEVGDGAIVVLLAGIPHAPIDVGDRTVAFRYAAVRLEHGGAAADLHVERERFASIQAPGLVRCELLGRYRQAKRKGKRREAEAQGDV